MSKLAKMSLVKDVQLSRISKAINWFCHGSTHFKLALIFGIQSTCSMWVLKIIMRFILKYGSEEKGSSFCKCSIFLGFIVSKNLRGLWFYVLIKVQNATSLVFLTWENPGRWSIYRRKNPFLLIRILVGAKDEQFFLLSYFMPIRVNALKLQPFRPLLDIVPNFFYYSFVHKAKISN